MNSQQVRILIIDDHYVVRQGLKMILKEQFEFAEFGEAANGQEALEQVWNHEWDVVLVDISMPGRGGLDVLKDLKHAKSKLPVIVLSMHSEDQYAIRSLKLGACSYVRKDGAGQELVLAVSSALTGTPYISPSIAQKLALHLQHDQEGPPHDALADREYQVMCMLASGKTVKEIAVELSLSAKTISTHRSRILEKMGLANNSQIMRYAVSHGLVDVEINPSADDEERAGI
jgi:two-component system, NarL family, invasion response regulator UvrY